MLYNGETENAWLADLMVGWGGDYRKVGSSSQSERLTKHNRLPVLDRKMGLACENVHSSDSSSEQAEVFELSGELLIAGGTLAQQGDERNFMDIPVKSSLPSCLGMETNTSSTNYGRVDSCNRGSGLGFSEHDSSHITVSKLRRQRSS